MYNFSKPTVNAADFFITGPETKPRPAGSGRHEKYDFQQI